MFFVFVIVNKTYEKTKKTSMTWSYQQVPSAYS